MMTGSAVVSVTYEQLLSALGMPEGVRLVAVVQYPQDLLGGTIQLVVAHSGLPERVEGAMPNAMDLAQLIERTEGGE